MIRKIYTHFSSVLIALAGALALAGCTASSTQTNFAVELTNPRAVTRPGQLEGSWEIYAIGERTVSGSFSPRIAFGDAQRVGGIAGCNRFLGSYSLGQRGDLTISDLRSTRRICPEPLMHQEALLLNWLREVENSVLTDKGELLLFSRQGDAPIRLRPELVGRSG